MSEMFLDQGIDEPMLPCPFCSAALEPFGPAQHNHPRNECWLASVKLEQCEYALWNARAALKTQPATPTPEYCPIEVVGDMVRNLLTLDQCAPIYAAFHIDYQGKRACRTRPVWISRERVVDGKWVDSARKDVPYNIIVWAKPRDDDKAPPAPIKETLGDPVGTVWYDREDGFYFAKIEAQDRVKSGDALYLAAVPRARLLQPSAADRFASARQALQQGIDKCATKYDVAKIDSASTELPKE